MLQADYEQAKHFASSARIEAHQLGNLQHEGTALHNLGDISIQEKNYESACDYLSQALKIRQRLGKPLYEDATKELIQQLASAIENDSNLEPSLRQQLIQRCQSILRS